MDGGSVILGPTDRAVFRNYFRVRAATSPVQDFASRKGKIDPA